MSSDKKSRQRKIIIVMQEAIREIFFSLLFSWV